MEGKVIELRSILLGKKNKNGRTYTKEHVLPALDRLKERMSKLVVLGQLGHPSSFETSMRSATHVVKGVRISRNRVYVSIELLPRTDTELPDLKDYVLSLRGLGNVLDDGTTVKLDEILTFDLIHKKDFAWTTR